MSPVRTRSPAQSILLISKKSKLNKDFFKKVRILDGGVGQELLARGLKTKGTLWSASALIQDKFHKLILKTHIDFIESGAEVIVTTTFSSRKQKLIENNVLEKFEELNLKAAELASKAKDKFPHIMIAGGLPPQNLVYQVDSRSDDEIMCDFYDQAKILSPYVDFFYLEVLSSFREVNLAVRAIESLKKPYLVGLHVSNGTELPSKEKISEIKSNLTPGNSLGLVLSCVSPENYQLNSQELSKLDCPYGFKLNGFEFTTPKLNQNKTYTTGDSVNPNMILGKRKDLNPEKFFRLVEKFKSSGATILGGCCETTPAHIKELVKLRN